jgi:Ran GTPase-activating protein (RanGAP) involved in mRNA processing and transport
VYAQAGDEGMKHVATALKENTTLQSLSVQRNLVTAVGMKPVFRALRKHNCTLTTLLLDDNELGGKGTDSLAKMLKVNEVLTELHASDSGLTGRHLRALAEGVRANSTLKTLNLSYNDLGKDGAMCLRDMLCEPGKGVLQDLRAVRCKITDRDAQRIADALMTNKSLMTLNLAENRIKSQGLQYLCAAMQENTTLTSMNVASHGVLASAMLPLDVFLRRNFGLERVRRKTAFCMGFHRRLGDEASMKADFAESAIFERNVVNQVWEYLYPPTPQERKTRQ